MANQRAGSLQVLDVVDASSMFKALSSPVRLQLLELISSHPDGEVCVCDVVEAFAVSPPTISHHLKVLREAGLVSAERRGTWIYYRAVPEARAGLARLLADPGAATGIGA